MSILLAWPNVVESAVLTSSASWLATLPLTEMQTRIFSDVAQTTNLTPSITATFSKFTRVGTIAITAHNLNSAATIRIRCYSDAAKTLLLADSGAINVWPRVYNSIDLAWESQNFWTGRPDQDDIAKFTPLFTWHATRNYYLRCIQIDIDSTGNPDGFIEIGRLFIAPFFEPETGPQPGQYDLQYTVNTDVTEALDDDSTEYFNVRKPKRTVSIGLDFLSKDDALLRLFDAQRTIGIDKEILFAESRAYTKYSMRTDFIGRLVSLDKLSIPYPLLYTNSLNIREIL